MQLVLCVGIIVYLIRSIVINVLGVEPLYLNKYFKQLAVGNFKAELDIDEDDESSVAYHFKKM